MAVRPLGVCRELQVTSPVVLFGARSRLGVRAYVRVTVHEGKDGDRVSARCRKEERKRKRRGARWTKDEGGR